MKGKRKETLRFHYHRRIGTRVNGRRKKKRRNPVETFRSDNRKMRRKKGGTNAQVPPLSLFST